MMTSGADLTVLVLTHPVASMATLIGVSIWALVASEINHVLTQRRV